MCTVSQIKINLFSSQCFCGDNEVLESNKTNEADCRMKCTGDHTAICGGDLRLTLYKIENRGKIPCFEVGCVYCTHLTQMNRPKYNLIPNPCLKWS